MNEACTCTRIHEQLDVYLDHELSTDDTVAFAGHLNTCPDLSELLALRVTLRARLRVAARLTNSPDGLDARIRLGLKARYLKIRRVWTMLAVAALVLLAFGLNMSWRAGGLRFTPAMQEGYIASLAPQVSAVMQIGLQQHVHCAVFHKSPSPPPDLQEMAGQLGPRYADLLPAMQRHLPAGFRVLAAHICDYHGRPYTHLTASDGTRLISLLITKRAPGEAFAAAPALSAASVQRFQLAGFETRDHLVYLISDLEPGQNLPALAGMAPDVARTIRTLEL